MISSRKQELLKYFSIFCYLLLPSSSFFQLWSNIANMSYLNYYFSGAVCASVRPSVCLSATRPSVCLSAKTQIRWTDISNSSIQASIHIIKYYWLFFWLFLIIFFWFFPIFSKKMFDILFFFTFFSTFFNFWKLFLLFNLFSILFLREHWTYI